MARSPSRSTTVAGALGATGAVALLLLAACGGDDVGTPNAHQASSPTPAPATSATGPSPVPSATATADDGSRYVDIGGGRQLYAQCQGTGSPTILLEAGDEADLHSWDAVYPELVAQTRTCRYDRLGVGASDEATGCREADDLRHDTEAMLRAMDVGGPMLLVGHSGGGYLMADLAYAHTAQVAGMVLVETPHAIVPSRESPELITQLDCRYPTNVEHRDYVRVENAAWSGRRELGPIPMTVVSNDYGDAAQGGEQEHNVAEQRGWLVLSPLARQVVVTSGHEVEVNQPELVVHQVLSVLRAARAG